MTKTLSIISALIMGATTAQAGDAVFVRVLDAGGNPVQCVAEVSPAPPPPGAQPATVVVIVDKETRYQTVTVTMPRPDLAAAISALRVVSGIGGRE